jgi:hypothetical protein
MFVMPPTSGNHARSWHDRQQKPSACCACAGSPIRQKPSCMSSVPTGMRRCGWRPASRAVESMLPTASTWECSRWGVTPELATATGTHRSSRLRLLTPTSWTRDETGHPGLASRNAVESDQQGHGHALLSGNGPTPRGRFCFYSVMSIPKSRIATSEIAITIAAMSWVPSCIYTSFASGRAAELGSPNWNATSDFATAISAAIPAA